MSRAVHVTVVSHTLNKTHENQKENPLTQLAQEGVSIRRQLERIRMEDRR